MQTKSFGMEYESVIDDEEYDVSFELSGYAEEMLVESLSYMFHDNVTSGQFDPRTVRLLNNIVKQQREHVPREDYSEKRVFDLRIDAGDVNTLARAVSLDLKNMVPEDDAIIDLMDMLIDIEFQIVSSKESSNPFNGEFLEERYGGSVSVFMNDNGDEWYRCHKCDTMYSELSEEHGCLQ